MSNGDHNPLSGTRGPIDVTAASAAQVEAWRKLRMSWDQIARSLGRSVPDVRKAFDPTWRGVA